MQQCMTRLEFARVREVYYEAWLERAAQDGLFYRDFLERALCKLIFRPCTAQRNARSARLLVGSMPS